MDKNKNWIRFTPQRTLVHFGSKQIEWMKEGIVVTQAHRDRQGQLCLSDLQWKIVTPHTMNISKRGLWRPKIYWNCVWNFSNLRKIYILSNPVFRWYWFAHEPNHFSKQMSTVPEIYRPDVTVLVPPKERGSRWCNLYIDLANVLFWKNAFRRATFMILRFFGRWATKSIPNKTRIVCVSKRR